MASLVSRRRDALAVGTIAASLVLGLSALRYGVPDPGIVFDRQADRIIVGAISPWGAAARSPLRPGMVVVQLNGAQVGELPTDPEHPQRAASQWEALLAEPTWFVGAIPAQAYERELRGELIEAPVVATYLSPGTVGEQAWPTLLAGLVVLSLITLWVLGLGASTIDRLAAPLAAATTVPLFMVPFAMSWGYVPQMVSTLLPPLAFLTLADTLTRLLAHKRRRATRIAVAGTAVASLIGGALLAHTGTTLTASLTAAALAACILIPPAVAVYRMGREASLDRADQFPTVVELAAIVITPALSAVVLALRDPGLLWLLVGWTMIVIAVQRFTVAPLTRMVRRTRLQRDLAIRATEAERARIASDLHDSALQDLTMLAMRLDATGDAESAADAREIAERVREICGELRLPLLDDFGVGPALEWLVDRLERLTPGLIRLEHHAGGRLPPEVELAIFRVAQEAIANAIRHGGPPISVRFESAGRHASLSVEDRGDGIAPDAAERAQQAGRYGLLNMHQRADQVGALLRIDRSSSGGTLVGLEWSP